VRVDVVAQPVAGKRADRAIRSPPGVVEITRECPVVEEESEAATQRRDGRGDPRLDRKADLCGLAIAEVDALVRKPPRDRRRGRVGPDVREGPAGVDRDEPLLEAPVPDADPVDGKRVDDLVGEDGPAERALLSGAANSVSETRAGQSLVERVVPTRLDLDGDVADRVDEPGARPLEAAQDRFGEGAAARPMFVDDERVGPVEADPHLRQLVRDGVPEDRVRLGGGEEISRRARVRLLRAVVAAVGVVQGQLHEPGEGHRAGRLDLGADPRGERRILADVGEIGRRDATQSGGQVHRFSRATSRRPGPTML
jgi:hypothetical protein